MDLEKLKSYRGLQLEKKQLQNYPLRRSDFKNQIDQDAAEIEAAIERIQNPEERVLLRYRYLDGYNWNKIGEKMRYSVRSLHRLHDKAVKSLEAQDKS